MSAATRLPDHGAILIREVTDIERVLRGLGLRVRRRGTGYPILCPWHNEKTPSCNVRIGPAGSIQVKCHGCEGGGNVLHLVAAVRGWDLRRDFRAVLDETARLGGVTLDAGRGGVLGAGRMVGPEAIARPDPAPPPPTRPDLDTFHRQVSTLLGACPLDGSVGVGLVSRGLIHEADADGWGELPENKHSASPEQDARAGFDTEDMAADRLVARLAAAGLSRALPWLVRDGRLAYPQHRLLIPWRAPQGQVWMLQRRWAPVFGDEPADGVDAGKYREDARAECLAYPYGIDAPELQDAAAEVWLVEGAADVLAVRALARAGVIPGTVAPLGLPGVGAWGRVRHAVLPLVTGRSVVIATDSDAAGDHAVVSMVGDLWGAGAEEVRRRRVVAPWKDWAEVARAHAERKLS